MGIKITSSNAAIRLLNVTLLYQSDTAASENQDIENKIQVMRNSVESLVMEVLTSPDFYSISQ